MLSYRLYKTNIKEHFMSNKTSEHGEFCWNELMTPNVKKAKEFYSELFGWETHDHDMEHMTYTMFKAAGKDIGGMMQIPAGQEQQIPPHWMSYIYVHDLDATVEKAKSLGALIKVDKTQVGDFGRFAIIEDPTGAHIAMWQSLKEC